MKHFLKAQAKEVSRAYLYKYDLSDYFGEVTNMNIVPNVELSIDKLITKAQSTNTSMVPTNISIGGLFKQLKSHFYIE